MTDLPPEGLPSLVIAGGPRNGETLVLEAPGHEKVLGSAPDCHLRFGGSSVDQHHAGIFWDETQGLLITDQGSASGTWVNGERVSGVRVLQDGDRISLGPPGSAESVKLLVQVPPQMEAPLVLDADEPVLLESDTFELPPDSAEDVFDASEQDATVPFTPSMPPAAIPSMPPAAIPPPMPAARPLPPPVTPAVIPDAGAGAKHSTYTDQLPSIAAERPREAFRLPPPVEKPRVATARAGPSRLMPLLLAVGALLALAGGGFLAYRLLSKARPTLASVAPTRAAAGQAVTLNGTEFASSEGDNVVRFGEQKGTVTTASETQLTVTVPATLGTATEVPVTVETRGGRSNAVKLALRIVPLPATLEPDVALAGAEVVIKGQLLDGKDPAVSVGGVNATIRETRPTALRFVVPRIENAIEGQGVVVSVQAGGEIGKPLTLTIGRLPLLTGLEPNRGEAGQRTVLRGRGFDPDGPANLVTFGGEPALVISASEKQLDVVVPALPAPGNQFKAPVTVQARGAASVSPFEFTVLRPSAGTFIPRFFPGSVKEDAHRAFVSSEAGPLLLLSSPDGSASTAERAVRVAGALNAVFKENTAPAFEVRAGDAVAVTGTGNPLLRATAEDAAGYSQPWNAAMKGQHVGPGQVAAHWANLLQDYSTLFLQKQRPTRVVEVSPVGKVLLELHAEGERRMGRGAGVPAGLLSPPGPVLANSMRELALTVPGRGQAVAGAALVGRWSGTMEETGQGPRSFQLLLRLDGTRLTGSVSTRAGQLTMDVPLKAVSYERGTLAFDVSGGPLRHFRGTASGSTLSGAIFDQAQKEIGRFTLQYID